MTEQSSQPRLVLLGRKKGMTERFDSQGNATACTVIEVQPNVVAQVKTIEIDGYEAIQLAADPIRVKQEATLNARMTQPLIGHFKKAGVKPSRFLTETRVTGAEQYQVGQEFTVAMFEPGSFVDASSKSKGKGYQGVIKRHHFAGGPAAHGSGFHRHGGSTGMRTTPGRTLPGQKKAGHMGDENTTIQALEVIEVLADQHVIVLKGAVPGPVGAAVKIAASLKRQPKSTKTRR